MRSIKIAFAFLMSAFAVFGLSSAATANVDTDVGTAYPADSVTFQDNDTVSAASDIIRAGPESPLHMMTIYRLNAVDDPLPDIQLRAATHEYGYLALIDLDALPAAITATQARAGPFGHSVL